MIKLIRLIALVVLLAAALTSTPVMACLANCSPLCVYGCKYVGACSVCCTKGEGCLPIG
jgi:hypothetical protein